MYSPLKRFAAITLLLSTSLQSCALNVKDAENYTPLRRVAQDSQHEVETISLDVTARSLRQEPAAPISSCINNEEEKDEKHAFFKNDMPTPASERATEREESLSIELLPLHNAALSGRSDVVGLLADTRFFPVRESFTTIEVVHENRLIYLSQMPADNWPVTQSTLEKIKGRISARTDRPDCYKKTKQFLQIAVPALFTGALVFFPVQTSAGRWLAFAVGGGANTLSVAMAWYWASKESREENYLQNTVKEYQEIYKDLSAHLLNSMDAIATRQIASKINDNFPVIQNKFFELFAKEDTDSILSRLETTVDYLSQQNILHFDPKSDKFLALDEACKQMVRNKYYEKKINHCMAEIASLKQKQE